MFLETSLILQKSLLTISTAFPITSYTRMPYLIVDVMGLTKLSKPARSKLLSGNAREDRGGIEGMSIYSC